LRPRLCVNVGAEAPNLRPQLLVGPLHRRQPLPVPVAAFHGCRPRALPFPILLFDGVAPRRHRLFLLVEGARARFRVGLMVIGGVEACVEVIMAGVGGGFRARKFRCAGVKDGDFARVHLRARHERQVLLSSQLDAVRQIREGVAAAVARTTAGVDRLFEGGEPAGKAGLVDGTPAVVGQLSQTHMHLLRGGKGGGGVARRPRRAAGGDRRPAGRGIHVAFSGGVGRYPQTVPVGVAVDRRAAGGAGRSA